MQLNQMIVFSNKLYVMIKKLVIFKWFFFLNIEENHKHHLEKNNNNK